MITREIKKEREKQSQRILKGRMENQNRSTNRIDKSPTYREVRGLRSVSLDNTTSCSEREQPRMGKLVEWCIYDRNLSNTAKISISIQVWKFSRYCY